MVYCGEVYVDRGDPAYGKWGILWKTRDFAGYAKNSNGEIIYFEKKAEAKKWLEGNRWGALGGFYGDGYFDVVIVRDYRCYY